jgi:hypothetical protein
MHTLLLDENVDQIFSIKTSYTDFIKYIPVILMYVLPNIEEIYNSYGTQFYIQIGVLLIKIIYDMRLYFQQKIKVFPKILDCGLYAINFIMIIISIWMHPSFNLFEKYINLITNSFLFSLYAIPLLFKKPITIQYEMEKINNSLWTNKLFIKKHRTKTIILMSSFKINMIIQCIFVYTNVENIIAKIIPEIVIFIIGVMISEIYVPKN